MNSFKQISAFYMSLKEEEQRELCEAIAEDIYFLDESMQERIIALLHKAEPEIGNRVRRINDFTT